MTQHYAVCAVKPWNVEAFHRRTPAFPGVWRLIDQPKLLSTDTLLQLAPRYVFFPHWSWRVPDDILSRFECVCFHMADVPYGRGGSPLQNLIARGHKTTMLAALRMIEDLDAGPVYLKRPLSLNGRAEDIFVRAADLAYDLMAEIVTKKIEPTPQTGLPVVFKRRTPEESRLPRDPSAEALYDHIRMLDAPSYPKAFLEWGKLRLEFDHAKLLSESEVEARVVIRK
jgi:methionyl-tRNA formyltransferase